MEGIVFETSPKRCQDFNKGSGEGRKPLHRRATISANVQQKDVWDG